MANSRSQPRLLICLGFSVSGRAPLHWRRQQFEREIVGRDTECLVVFQFRATCRAHLQRGTYILGELHPIAKFSKLPVFGGLVCPRFLGHVLGNQSRRLAPFDIAVFVPQRVDLTVMFIGKFADSGELGKTGSNLARPKHKPLALAHISSLLGCVTNLVD